MSDPTIITLEGSAKNALSSEMMQFIIDQLDAASPNPVILTGTGDSFSAGLHLFEVAMLDAEGMQAFLALLLRMVEKLFLYPAPTVAVVNGHAIAGGCVLALACDRSVAVANEQTRIGLNEVRIGVRFPPRILRMVQYRVPSAHLEQVVLRGSLVPPEAAVGWGLIDAVEDDAMAWAKREIEALTRSPADTYAATKLALRAPVMVEDPAEEARFLDEALPVWTGDELKNRLARFLK